MLPDVEKYLAALEAADREYNAAGVPEHDLGVGPLACPACLTSGVPGQARRAARNAAWAALKVSRDPVVAWIGEHCDDYRAEAQHILVALPAALEDMGEIARSQDWCGEWERLRGEALKAGVVSETEVSA